MLNAKVEVSKGTEVSSPLRIIAENKRLENLAYRHGGRHLGEGRRGHGTGIREGWVLLLILPYSFPVQPLRLSAKDPSRADGTGGGDASPDPMTTKSPERAGRQTSPGYPRRLSVRGNVRLGHTGKLGREDRNNLNTVLMSWAPRPKNTSLFLFICLFIYFPHWFYWLKSTSFLCCYSSLALGSLYPWKSWPAPRVMFL